MGTIETNEIANIPTSSARFGDARFTFFPPLLGIEMCALITTASSSG